MTGLYRYSIRRPVVALVIVFGVTAAVAPGVIWLQLRTDGHALVPEDAPAVRFDASVRDAFDVRDLIVVLVRSEHERGLFNVHTLKLVRGLTESIQRELGDDADVMSLATEKGHRVYPGTLTLRPFLDPLPEDRREIDQLRDDLQRIQLYHGTFVSYDERSTAIFVGVPPGVDRTEYYREVSRIVDAHQGGAERIHVIGAPVAEALLGTHILEDLGVPEVALGGRTRVRHEWSWPHSWYEFRLLIAHHIGLVPIAIGIMAVVFLLCFGSLSAVFLPLSEVGACLAFVFGLMGWSGVPVYITIAVMPVILTAVGAADEIHIFNRYAKKKRAGGAASTTELVRETMNEMWRPVVKTSITTAVAFLSFGLSPMAPVRAFGIFTAAGVIFCMLYSLTAVPALLVLLQPLRRSAGDARLPRPETVADTHKSFTASMGQIVVKARWPILLLVVVLLVAAPFGVRRVRLQDSWIDGFAEDSGFRRATKLFNEQFKGTHVLMLCVDTGHDELSGHITGCDLQVKRPATPDDEQRYETVLPAEDVPDVVPLTNQYIRLHLLDEKRGTDTQPGGTSARLREWDAIIESAERVGDQVAIQTPLPRGAPAYALDARDDDIVAYRITPERLTDPVILELIERLERFINTLDEYAVGGVMGPASFARTTNYLSNARNEARRRIPDTHTEMRVVWSRYVLARGEDRLRQLIDEDYARGLITIYMKDANFQDTARLMAEIRDYEQRHLAPYRIELGFAGDVAVSQTLIGAIVSTQVRSVLLSLCGILVVTSILGRSVRWGFYCVIPCGLAVLVNFAAMGVLGIPLGVATSMFAGMTLGIGVDYAIHLLERYRVRRDAGGGERESITDALRVTGPAIIIDAVAVGLGFSVMLLSQVPANERLGALLVLSIMNCLVATLVVLPALLAIWPMKGRSGTVPASEAPPDHA